MSRPCSVTRPLVGRARQPISVSSVVLPEPLGPRRAVTRFASMVERDAGQRPVLVVLALVEGLADVAQFDHARITASGSVTAARQMGTSTAAM